LMQVKGKGHLALLATSHGMNHVYQLLTPLVIPEMKIDYGFSYTTAGLLLSCFVLSYSLLPVVSGFLSKKFGRRNLLTLGFVVSALSFLGMGLTSNIAVLGLLLFIAGAGGSTYHPNGVPFLAETYSNNRGQTLGLHQTGGALGSVVGLSVAAFLVQSLTWKPALMLLAVPGLILAVILLFAIGAEKSSVAEGAQSQTRKIRITDLKTYGPALIYIAAAFIFVLGQRGTDLFGNVYFVNGRGIDFAEASFFFILLKVAGLFSAPICGKLSDIYDRKNVLIALVIVESISLYAITATPVIFLAVPCLIFGFAAFGLLGVGEALLVDVTPADQRNTIFGINYTTSFTVSLVLAPTLGPLADRYGFATGFLLLSAIMPLSIFLIMKIRTQHRHNNRNSFKRLRVNNAFT
jgi:ACS family hexuronate transporter-like MFS transporter